MRPVLRSQGYLPSHPFAAHQIQAFYATSAVCTRMLEQLVCTEICQTYTSDNSHSLRRNPYNAKPTAHSQHCVCREDI